jgi:hypothetical protein
MDTYIQSLYEAEIWRNKFCFINPGYFLNK